VTDVPGAPIERRCARCGAAFGCGIETGACWCASVEVDPATRAELAERYDGCLCPACLRAPDRVVSRFQEPSAGA
jgi:hypothetical protein